MHCEHTFTLQAADHAFTLQRNGESWSKRFESLFDAIRHAEMLPCSKGASLIIYNQLGHVIGRLLL